MEQEIATLKLRNAGHLDKDDPMTRRIAARFTLPVVAPLGFCLLLGAGCVSQHTYDTVRTEADELTRALDAARSETQTLEQEIASLKLRNKQEDAALAEVRAAIRDTMEAAPMVRQRADDKLGALQTQVAYLVNQNRLLGREMADAKQERVVFLCHRQMVSGAERAGNPLILILQVSNAVPVEELVPLLRALFSGAN